MRNIVPDAVGVDGLIGFWDFQEPRGSARTSRGPYTYVLREAVGPISRVLQIDLEMQRAFQAKPVKN